MESEKTAAGEGEKEEIIMRRGGKCKGKASQVVNREWELAQGWRAKLAQAALVLRIVVTRIAKSQLQGNCSGLRVVRGRVFP